MFLQNCVDFIDCVKLEQFGACRTDLVDRRNSRWTGNATAFAGHTFDEILGKPPIQMCIRDRIISRLLNRPVTTSISYTDPDIPPIGYIDGMDLVTEGVLTLSKTCLLYTSRCV